MPSIYCSHAGLSRRCSEGRDWQGVVGTEPSRAGKSPLMLVLEYSGRSEGSRVVNAMVA